MVLSPRERKTAYPCIWQTSWLLWVGRAKTEERNDEGSRGWEGLGDTASLKSLCFHWPISTPQLSHTRGCWFLVWGKCLYFPLLSVLFPPPFPYLPPSFAFIHFSKTPKRLAAKTWALGLTPHMSGNSKDKHPPVTWAWLCMFYGTHLITLQECLEAAMKQKWFFFLM